jgi:TolA-binding protein
MGINENLLETLRTKNPDLSFAIQESFPLKGTYADAAPLGPLMELGAQAGQNNFTSEHAAQSLDYWRNTAQQVLADPEAASSPNALKSYSHDTVAAANLLAAHNFTDEAEQAYRLAAQLWPGNPESAGGLADVLSRTGREAEARQVLGDFARKYPDQRAALERTSSAFLFVGRAQQPHP